MMEVEIVKGFRYLGNVLNASGGSETTVVAMDEIWRMWRSFVRKVFVQDESVSRKQNMVFEGKRSGIIKN